MDYLTAIFLGVLQGFTEFLPISSSGHLVIAQSIIPGFRSPGALFEVILHAGTMLAILAYFMKSIKLDFNYVKLLFIGSLPVGIIGFLFADQIEKMFTSALVAGVALMFTGVINILIDKLKPKEFNLKTSSSLVIGIAQAMALIPGLSRVGSTVFAARIQGINKRTAAEFSFILSLPAVFGANVFQVYKYGLEASVGVPSLLIGFTAAAISGFFAIKLVIRLLVQEKFRIFGIYALIVGMLVVVSNI